MKKPICFLALTCVLFSLMLFGCNESIRFEQPQPTGLPELSKIPKKLRGTYQEDDSIFLVIGKKTIVEKAEGIITETLEEIAKDIADDDEKPIISDSSSRGFKAYYKDENARFEINYDQSGMGRFQFSNERFAIGSKNVIKSKGGVYYVNIYRKQDTAWILRKLVLKGKKLTTYKVSKPSDIAELVAITGVSRHLQVDGDSEGWMIDPTPEVLDELFEKYGKKVKEYTRIK